MRLDRNSLPPFHTFSKKITLALRLLIVAAGVTFILMSVTWSDQYNDAGKLIEPGILTVLASANWQWLVLGMSCVAVIFPIQAIRWYMLLLARGMNVGYWRAFQLTLVGTFFNFCLPGSTGGDFVKAYYAAKRSDRRTDTVISVVVDRITGVLGLLVLSAFAGLHMFEYEVIKTVTILTWTTIAGIVLFAGLYLSRGLRRELNLGAVVSRLPGHRWIRKIDDAILVYRNHAGVVSLAVGLSLVVQLLLTTGTALAGYAVEMQAPIGVLFTVIPLLYLLGAIPLTYQGLGLMEWLATQLLLPAGLASVNQIIIMLFIARVYKIIMGLFGAGLMVKGGIYLHADSANMEVVTE